MTPVAALHTASVAVVACPLCGGATAPLHQLAHTTAWRCTGSGCDLRFAAPQAGEAELRETYRALYYPGAGASSAGCEGTPDAILRDLVQSLRARLGSVPDPRLLDFGCGRGALGRIALEAGLRAAGIERDANARAVAAGIANFPVYAGIQELRRQEPEARFDVITLWQVVEHLREPWSELAQLRELLTPGGLLVIATPNAAGLKARLVRAGWENLVNPTHFYYFTAPALRRVLEAAGFAAIERLRVASAYPHHGPARRLLQNGLRALRLDGDLVFVARADAGGAHP